MFYASLQGVFGSKLKSPIGFKNVVKLISRYNAPEEVWYRMYVSSYMQCDCRYGSSHVSNLLQVKLKYLNEISDVEDRLKLAMDYKVHSLAIDVRTYMYVAMYICVCIPSYVAMAMCVHE